MQSAALSPLSMMKRFVEGTARQQQPEESELDQLRKRLAEVEANMKKKARSTEATQVHILSTALLSVRGERYLATLMQPPRPRRSRSLWRRRRRRNSPRSC